MATANAIAPLEEATSRQHLANLCQACGNVLRLSNAYRLTTTEAERAVKREQIRVLHRHARKLFESLWTPGEERLAKAHRTDSVWHMQKADAAFSSVFPGEPLKALVELPAAAVASPAATEEAPAE